MTIKLFKVVYVKSSTLLGVLLTHRSKPQILETLSIFLEGKTLNHLATVNPEFLVEAHQNKTFKKLLNQTSLNVCDGFGISFWTKILYKKDIARITGVSLAEQLCKIAAEEHKSVYFLGGFGVAKPASEVMKSKYPQLIIAGTEDGNPQQISDQLLKAQPDILLVAFGAPAQEFWIDTFKVDLKKTRIAVGIGGTFDFWAGKTKRAPKPMRQIGLEWLWRLITQPQRVKRIYNAVVVFSWLVLKEKIQGQT